MPYSDAGYKMACEFVIPRMLEALDRLAPNTGKRIIQDIAIHADSQLEESMADKALFEALSDTLGIAADWEHLRPEAAQAPQSQEQLYALGARVSALEEGIERVARETRTCKDEVAELKNRPDAPVAVPLAETPEHTHNPFGWSMSVDGHLFVLWGLLFVLVNYLAWVTRSLSFW